MGTGSKCLSLKCDKFIIEFIGKVLESLAECPTPGMEFNYVQAALPILCLAHHGLRCAKSFSQLGLRHSRSLAGFGEQA